MPVPLLFGVSLLVTLPGKNCLPGSPHELCLVSFLGGSIEVVGEMRNVFVSVCFLQK